jgi:LuxR family maltose regulon positive regulatory protein
MPPSPSRGGGGYGQIVELRQNDLRLTPEEGALFLSRTMEVDLPVETARTLTEHTEGWIAGMQMAALSMPRREDLAGWIRTIGSGNMYILDYLMDEVWKQQPPGVQQFLLQTSVLDRF